MAQTIKVQASVVKQLSAEISLPNKKRILIEIINKTFGVWPQGEQGEPGENWLNGADGQEVMLQATDTHIQWKYELDVVRQDLIALSELIWPEWPPGEDGLNGTNWTNGTDGSDGIDGREIELQATDTYIQWRYVWDPTWTNLIEIAELSNHVNIDWWTPFSIPVPDVLIDWWTP